MAKVATRNIVDVADLGDQVERLERLGMFRHEYRERYLNPILPVVIR